MNLRLGAWIVLATLGVMAALAGTFDLHDRLLQWHKRADSLGKRVLLYSVLLLVIGALVYTQQSKNEEVTKPPTDTSVTGTFSTGTTATQTASATTTSSTGVGGGGTNTSTSTMSGDPPPNTDTEQHKKQWEAFDQAVIGSARNRPPDYEEVIAPNGFSAEINCQEHAMKIWAFDLAGPAEGYWFYGGGESDMVVAACVDKGNWKNCTPTTHSEHPPKYMRLHNLDPQRSLNMKIWFVQYAGPANQS